MSKIQVMDELLANKIAAGEVVERCASVVKELVENSIDAESTEIKIDLIDAGTKEIKVTDNGIGMLKEDALLAFQRHATSKLMEEDDLYHINTLGFRGEALPSIASVSDIELKTSTGDVGTVIHISGGKITSIENGDARIGTVMTVRDIFYNTPARLKHMKSLYTELASITDYVNKIALSYPNIKMTLTNNNSILLNTDGSSNLLKTIKDIFGIEVAKRMIKVEDSDADYEVSGYITLPEVHRATRNHMITLVNGRVVRNTELNRAINDAYHSYKPDNRYPITVLNIEVDPYLIDVNIHPTKMDIKFSKLEELCALIDKMIKKCLNKETLIPHMEVRRVEQTQKPHYEEMKLDISRTGEVDFSYQKDEPITTENVEALEEKKEPLVYEEVIVNDDFTTPKEEIVERLPELYPVGVIHGTYIICQNETGMYLIDQHAAKERINYETFKEEMGNPKKDSIPLLFPVIIELTNQEFIILKENIDILNNMHFDVADFGIHSIIIKAHPIWLPKGNEEVAIRKIVEMIVHKEKEFSITKFNEKVATMLSCKLAIKANDFITMKEMEQLIDDLKKCKDPFHCPHGRPTMIFYSNYDLEKLFKRSGF